MGILAVERWMAEQIDGHLYWPIVCWPKRSSSHVPETGRSVIPLFLLHDRKLLILSNYKLQTPTSLFAQMIQISDSNSLARSSWSAIHNHFTILQNILLLILTR